VALGFPQWGKKLAGALWKHGRTLETLHPHRLYFPFPLFLYDTENMTDTIIKSFQIARRRSRIIRAVTEPVALVRGYATNSSRGTVSCAYHCVGYTVCISGTADADDTGIDRYAIVIQVLGGWSTGDPLASRVVRTRCWYISRGRGWRRKWDLRAIIARDARIVQARTTDCSQRTVYGDLEINEGFVESCILMLMIIIICSSRKSNTRDQ
jgi:hypothetical protein